MGLTQVHLREKFKSEKRSEKVLKDIDRILRKTEQIAHMRSGRDKQKILHRTMENHLQMFSKNTNMIFIKLINYYLVQQK